MGALGELKRLLGASPFEMLRQMDQGQRNAIVFNLVGKVLFVGALVIIGASAALAVRGPTRPTVTEIVDNPVAISRLADAIIEKDNRVDLLCAVRYTTYGPHGEVVDMRCYRRQPEVGPP